MKFLCLSSLAQLSNSKIDLTKRVISSITNLLILLSIFILINKSQSTKQKQKNSSKDTLKYLSHSKTYPDELDDISKILGKQSKECFNEIVLIYARDFTQKEFKNPYNLKSNAITEKYFQKINNQIWKKLNKISFLESKNFTGIRWIEFKSSNNTELKRMMDSHLQLLAESMQKNLITNEKTEVSNKKQKKNGPSTVYMNLPEIIVDSYQYFYSKINDLKKFFSKFYLYKGINKFNKCVAVKEKVDIKIAFAESIKSGKITMKSLLESLKDIYTVSHEMIKAEDFGNFVKALKKLVLIVKRIPGM